MKTKLTRLALAFALALTALNRVEGEDSSTDSSAAASKAEELNRRSIERRAVEAVIWGMPAVNYEEGSSLSIITDRGCRSAEERFR